MPDIHQCSTSEIEPKHNLTNFRTQRWIRIIHLSQSRYIEKQPIIDLSSVRQNINSDRKRPSEKTIRFLLRLLIMFFATVILLDWKGG